MLSEGSQTKKNVYHMILYICSSHIDRTIYSDANQNSPFGRTCLEKNFLG